MKVLHGPNGKPFDPANPNNPQNPPANAADLDPDDYNTDCNCDADHPTSPMEKIPAKDPGFGPMLLGIIRWIDAPGDKSVRATDFNPSGYHLFDFKKWQVIDYPACNTGCKKCVVWEAQYDKDGNRVGGPPRITNSNPPCP